MTRQLYTTPQMMRILGVTSRQTIYNWDAKPDQVGPGERGLLLWSKRTILSLAEQHGGTADFDAVLAQQKQTP